MNEPVRRAGRASATSTRTSDDVNASVDVADDDQEKLFLSTMLEDQTSGLSRTSGSRKLCAKHRHRFQQRLDDSVSSMPYYQQNVLGEDGSNSQQRKEQQPLSHIKTTNQNLATIAPSSASSPPPKPSTFVQKDILKPRHTSIASISTVPSTLTSSLSTTNIVRTRPLPTFSSFSNFAFTFTNNPFLVDASSRTQLKVINDTAETTPTTLLKTNIVELDTTIEVISDPALAPKR